VRVLYTADRGAVHITCSMAEHGEAALL